MDVIIKTQQLNSQMDWFNFVEKLYFSNVARLVLPTQEW